MHKIFTTRRPYCECLYEIENNLPRTKHCFMACPDQFQILREREALKKEKEDNKDEDKK